MELNENITQLIIRQLNGEASDREQAELTDWLDEHPAHRQEYEDYVRIWEESLNVVTRQWFDTADAWNKVQKKIHPPSAVVPVEQTRVFTLKRMLVAASVIIAMSIAVIYFFRAEQNSSWETLAATSSNQLFTLPDGSSVMLRKGSTLKFAGDFISNRKTELNGEAFFEVQRHEKHPFSVQTTDAIIEVLGTSFLVRHTDSLDRVVVKIGRVRFAQRGDTDNGVVLNRGQQAELKNNKIIRDTITNDNYLAWNNGNLIFNNTPLRQVMFDISNLYNVSVRMTPAVKEQANAITIQAEFRNQTLAQVLDEIRLMTGLKLTISENEILLDK